MKLRLTTHSPFIAVIAFALLVFSCGDPGRVETADPRPGDDVGPDMSGLSDVAIQADAAVTDFGSASTCGCIAGEGTFCFAAAEALAADAGCELPDIAGPDDLMRCAADAWSVEAACEASCEPAEESGADECGLPYCECFVQVAWCGASAARHGLTLDPPCRVPLAAENDQDILGCDANGDWIVQEVCADGCYEAATGTPDACLNGRTPGDPEWEPCPRRDLIRSGVHPEASDRLRCAGVAASQITQTIGSAAASAGYHASDGTVDGAPYTAAIDLSVRGMNEAQIKDLLIALGRNGFAAWYRKPGSDGWPASESPHIHAVFAGVKMKSQLRGQVRDFLVGRNGLASHTTYRFWIPGAAILEIVRILFERNYTP